ncbi:MAG: hypothetical protein ACOYOB_00770 [Myxococcota bacterium]
MKTLRELLAGHIGTACAIGLAATGVAACGDSGSVQGDATDTVVGDATDTTEDVALPDTVTEDTVAPDGRAELCAPCTANEQCQGTTKPDSVCVDFGKDGAFCGAKCTVDTDCADGYGCSDVKDVAGAAVKQCVPKAGALCTCSVAATAGAWDTTCFVADDKGVNKCTGTRKCEAGGLSACSAKAPSAEICDGLDNDCNAQTDDVSCDDQNLCTDDKCAGVAGCENKANTAACDADGSACTDKDACKDGTCAPGKALDCDDKNPCTDDSCDPTKGCQYANNTVECADGKACTLGDMCKDGTCQAGALKACETGDACLIGGCDEATGKCTKATRPDGTPCDDASACTVSDVCLASDATTSTCGGEIVDCDDLSNCTADSCDPTVGCKHAPLDVGVCNDGNACTLDDACVAGKCSGAALEVAKACDDKDPCTADTCSPDKGCVHDVAGADGAACEDGNPCTPNDKCKAGTCEGGVNQCQCTKDADCAPAEDGDLCNGTLVCDKADPMKWVCNVNKNTIVKCDESLNTACQSVACDTATGKCVVSQAEAGTACNADNDVCTVKDACANGICAKGSAEKCDDSNGCTNDTCDPKNGCKFTPNTASCDADGDACTVNDICAGGSCVAGAKKVCDDSEECTKDSCDATSALCVFEGITATCDDGNACTTGDACGSDPATKVYTCVPGKGVDCDDGNPCTIDSCAKDNGCAHKVDTNVKAACFPGDPANQGKGKCKDGVKFCQADGKFGSCTGAVLPGSAELCNGIDDTCNGATDEGCEPGSSKIGFGVAAISATGATYGTQSYMGTSAVTGDASGGEKYFARLGWYIWLRTLIGQ